MRGMQRGFVAILILLLSTTGLLAQDNGADEFFTQWSPDSKALLYFTNNQGTPNLYIVNRDGTERRALTELQSVSGAQFSPDGKLVAITESEGNDVTLHLLNLADGTDTPLFNDAGYAGSVSWSPDSRRLLFIHSINGYSPEYTVYLSGINGNPSVVTIPENLISLTVVWSPNGQSFYLTGTNLNNNHQEVYIFNADGTINSGNLLKDYWFTQSGCCFNLLWSPDSAWLAFDEAWDGTIYKLNVRDESIMPLVYTGGQVASMGWGANGSKLYYVLKLPESIKDTFHSGRVPGLYQVNPRDGVPHVVYEGTDSLAISPSGKQVGVLQLPADDTTFTGVISFLSLANNKTVTVNLPFINGYGVNWSPDSSIAVASLCSEEGDFDIFLLNPLTGESTNLTPEDDFIRAPQFSACGIFDDP